MTIDTGSILRHWFAHLPKSSMIRWRGDGLTLDHPHVDWTGRERMVPQLQHETDEAVGHVGIGARKIRLRSTLLRVDRLLPRYQPPGALAPALSIIAPFGG